MENEFASLVNILFEVIEANKGVTAEEDNRVLDAEGLAVKFLLHISSVQYLYEGTKIPELNLHIFDLPSLNVISRAAIETFLVFFYVFIDPKDDDEKNFRYWSYVLSGLIERQKYPIESPQGKRQLGEEKIIIANLIDKLKSNIYFSKLTSEFQNKIIKKGEWRLKGWSEIALSAGLSTSNSVAYYRYLCGYSHSGSLSIWQICQSHSEEKKKMLFNATLNLIKIAVANMIYSYCKYFMKSNDKYENLGSEKELVVLWLEVGATELDKVEIDWNDLDL